MHNISVTFLRLVGLIVLGRPSSSIWPFASKLGVPKGMKFFCLLILMVTFVIRRFLSLLLLVVFKNVFFHDTLLYLLLQHFVVVITLVAHRLMVLGLLMVFSFLLLLFTLWIKGLVITGPFWLTYTSVILSVNLVFTSLALQHVDFLVLYLVQFQDILKPFLNLVTDITLLPVSIHCFYLPNNLG